jgi:hypothetical protein
MARLLRYIHPHVSRYAQVDVPCKTNHNPVQSCRIISYRDPKGAKKSPVRALTGKFIEKDTVKVQLFLIQSQTSAAKDTARQISINQYSVIPYLPHIIQFMV